MQYLISYKDIALAWLFPVWCDTACAPSWECVWHLHRPRATTLTWHHCKHPDNLHISGFLTDNVKESKHPSVSSNRQLVLSKGVVKRRRRRSRENSSRNTICSFHWLFVDGGTHFFSPVATALWFTFFGSASLLLFFFAGRWSVPLAFSMSLSLNSSALLPLAPLSFCFALLLLFKSKFAHLEPCIYRLSGLHPHYSAA